MPAAMRCAAYLSGFVVVGLVANCPFAWLYGIASDLSWFDTLGDLLQIDDESVAILAWVVADLLWLAVYLHLFHRMLKSARHANR
jgi:hypothetical protein